MTVQLIKNRYRLLEQIGNGGMAEVYKAHDELLDRAVAVKLLRAQFSGDQDFVRRFKREAQAAARLSHPNIVNIYDVGEEDARHYIVMEFVDGMTLKERIDQCGKLSWREAVYVAREIADALGHAHQLGLIHCDIKPHNILIGTNGRVKVTDFGIARAISSAAMTMGGDVFGSIHYFSPEQARGKAMDGKSDLYSLGILLFEMITGKVPFQAETPIATALLHLQEEIPPLPLEGAIPTAVEAVIRRATQKNPADRYGTAEEMVRELTSLDAGMITRIPSPCPHNQQDIFATKVLSKLGDELSQAALASAADDEEDLLPVPEQSWWRNRRFIGSVVAIMLTGFILGAFLAYGKFWSNTEVKVPDVTGKPIEIARALLSEQNLRTTISETYHPKVPAGHVISQTPEAGLLVKEQRQITLVVSKGNEMISVPDVKGLKRQDAEITLKNAGLRIGKVEEQTATDVPPGTVITQNPRSPAQVSKGAVIDLVIGKGASSGKSMVPDVRGSTMATATKALEDRKLKVGTVTEISSDRVAQGAVVNQMPLPGTETAEGSAVDLVISKGAAATAKRAAVNFTVPEGPIRQNVQIFLTDSGGRKLVYENVLRPGDKIDRYFDAVGPGSVRVQIYCNGALVQDASQ